MRAVLPRFLVLITLLVPLGVRAGDDRAGDDKEAAKPRQAAATDLGAIWGELQAAVKAGDLTREQADVAMGAVKRAFGRSTNAGSAVPPSNRVLCCGGEEVFVIDLARPQVKTWTWRARDSPSMPESFHAKFRSTDDCKPYVGERLLVTSSSGGVAMLDRRTKECLFVAECRNAHSACPLPGERLVVASSYGGDELMFFDLPATSEESRGERRPAVAVQLLPLEGAHGTVWDSKRTCLWALGGEELLRVVENEDATADRRWSVAGRFALPSEGGHDLSPTHDGRRLVVTTNSQVLLFDRNERSFEPHPAKFVDGTKIKSVDLHPTTKRIVFQKASREHWSSDTLRFVGDEPIQVAGERLYKLRWDAPAIMP